MPTYGNLKIKICSNFNGKVRDTTLLSLNDVTEEQAIKIANEFFDQNPSIEPLAYAFFQPTAYCVGRLSK